MVSSGFAQNGKSLGLAGAYTSLARRSDALYWNPANLAFRNHNDTRVDFSFYSLQLGAGINSFNKDVYDKYFGFEGDSLYLDNAAKNEILGEIPDKGFTFDVLSNISVLTLRILNFGINFETDVYATGTIPKEFFDLALNGFSKSRYDFEPNAEALAYSKVKFSYGRIVKRDKSLKLPGNKALNFKDISVGGSFSYILGYGYAKVESGVVTVKNGTEGLDAYGTIITKEAVAQEIKDEDGFGFAGKGFGFDLAFSAVTYDNITVSAVVENIIGQINWDNGTIERRATLDIDGPKYIIGAGELEDIDEDEISEDEEIPISSFKTNLPRDFRLGISKETNRFLGSFEMGMEREEFFGAVGVGGRLGFFNLFMGYRNYESRSYFSAGFAFDFKYFYWDFGAINKSGIWANQSKGAMVSTSMRIGF